MTGVRHGALPNEILPQLRRVVSDAPEELFHMRAVVEHSPCGTARCALGWAAVDPWFQQNTRMSEVIPHDYDSATVGWRDVGATFRGMLPSIFGLNYEQFVILFGCRLSAKKTEPHAVSKQEVLDNIDRLIRGEKPIEYAAVARTPYA